LSLVYDILLLFCNLQFLLIVFVLVQLLSDLSNDTFDNSLVNSRVQESGNICSTENVCSEVQTVHSQSDQSDVTILEKSEDVKSKISEIIKVNESDVCELPEDIIALRNNYNEAWARDVIVAVNESDACELPEDIIALRHHYNEAWARDVMVTVNENYACELPEDIIALRHYYDKTRAIECDQSVVRILEKNEDIKPAVNEKVLESEGDLCEDNKQKSPQHFTNVTHCAY